MCKTAPLQRSGETTIHSTIRRKSNSPVGEDETRTPPEPPAKRIRTDSETTTVKIPLTSTSTSEAMAHGPLDTTTSKPSSSLAIERLADSDMILESDSDAFSSPQQDKEGATGKKTDDDDIHFLNSARLQRPRCLRWIPTKDNWRIHQCLLFRAYLSLHLKSNQTLSHHVGYPFIFQALLPNLHNPP